MKNRIRFLFTILLFPLFAFADSSDSTALNELANARRLLAVIEARIEAARLAQRSVDEADLRKVQILRANVAARAANLKLPVDLPAPTAAHVQRPGLEPVSRLTAWSSVLQRQVPIRDGTRIVIDGVLASVIEVIHPFQVVYLRMDGGEGVLTGRREYPSVYATVEVNGIEGSNVFREDIVHSRRGEHLGSIEAIFDDGSIFIQRKNGQIEFIGKIGDPALRAFSFTRTRATSCRLSF